jgi:hypothetical protein
MRRASLLFLLSGLAVAACSTGAPGDPDALPLRVRTHSPGPPAFLNAGDVCPPRPIEPLPLPATDSWSGLITLKEASDTLWLVPIHSSLTLDGDLMLFGFSRFTAAFDQNFSVSPTFLIKPDLYTEADITQRATIYGVPYDSDQDSWVCGGHTTLEDGRLVVVGGTRSARSAKTTDGGQAREFGLTYGAIFGDRGWNRIPRDYIGGEAWYPSLVRLSDGRLLMYSGYFELEADNVRIGAILKFNRTMQFYDPNNADEPWSVLSATVDTPEATEPSNYTWIFELPAPINAAGADRQLFIMGKSGLPFLLNHVDPFADAKARFVPRKPRPAPPELLEPAAAATVFIAPYFHESEKLFYRPGSIVVVGGPETGPVSEAVDVYDPFIDQWCPGSAPLGIGRKNAFGVYLPDGNVLLVNDDLSKPGVPGPVNEPERLTPQILDLRTGQVARGKPEPLNTLREYHNVATLVPDGRIFIGGGRGTHKGGPDDPDERSDFHYYSPYYLGILPPSDRPQILSIPVDPVMHYEKEYAVDYKNGEITGASIIAIGSGTHATDFNARFIELELTAGGMEPRGKVMMRGPQGPRIAPPGHYMLFLLRKVGGVSVPSVAQIIRVGGANPTCEGAPVNACGGCRLLDRLPGAECYDICGAGKVKCDGPNKTSCNACL